MDSPPLLPRSVDSRDSIGSVEFGVATHIPPPKSPAIPEHVQENSAALPWPCGNAPPQRKWNRLDSADSTMSSTGSQSSMSLFRTATKVELLPEEQVASMRAVFDMFDTSKDGVVQADEVGALLRQMNLVTSRRMIRTIVEIVDIDGDGEIDFGEFVTLLARVKQEVAAVDDDPEEEEERLAEGADADDYPVFVKLTPEEKAAKKLRQQAMNAFQRAVTMMAFTHLAADDDALFAELMKVLSSPPMERTEWELQRLLLWAEHYKKADGTVGFNFIQELPGPEESDVRIEVCRCMTVERFEEGATVMRQGEKGECMYIVLKGEVDVLVDINGAEESVATLGEGNSVGDLVSARCTLYRTFEGCF